LKKFVVRAKALLPEKRRQVFQRKEDRHFREKRTGISEKRGQAFQRKEDRQDACPTAK
jgi:hypothetical protein